MLSSSRRLPEGVRSSMRHPPSARMPIQSVKSLRPLRLPHRLLATSGLREALGDIGPVDDVPPRPNVVRTTVLILEIVRVLPDIAAKQRCLAGHEWCILVRVFLMASFPLRSEVSQPHPLPNLPTQALVNCSLNCGKPPKLLLMSALASSPSGSLAPPGAIISQKIV